MNRFHLMAISLAFLLITSTPALAAQFGPAQPVTNQGELSVGVGFLYHQADWERNLDVTQTRVYAQLSYGLLRNWEIYGQLGAADLEIDNTPVRDFSDGFRPFAGGGIRGLLVERRPVTLGAFVQGAVFSEFKDGNRRVEDQYEINGGFALQTVLEGAILYGGPFFYLHRSDVTVPGFSGRVDEDGNLGGFIGIRWPLKNGTAIELEAQVKTKASVGGALHFVF